jgi:8-oxo-dGTP pyrophosphatase MutT (NUDIX family)
MPSWGIHHNMNDHPEVIYPQAAAIPVQLNGSEPRILLITSRQRRRWIVPKGLIEDDQSPQEAALAETYEEAGVRGTIIGGSVGSYEYHKWGGTCRVAVFLLRVEEELPDWPESDYRDRKWVGLKQALEMIDNPDLCRIIERAVGSSP